MSARARTTESGELLMDPQSPGPELPLQAPPFWPWYVTYCAFMALLYLACVGMGAVFLLVDPEAMGSEPFEAILTGVVLIAISLPLMLAFAAGPFLPRRSWAWIAGMLLICVGMTSCCCIPACLPMLLQWIKPDTKAWFGYTGA